MNIIKVPIINDTQEHSLSDLKYTHVDCTRPKTFKRHSLTTMNSICVMQSYVTYRYQGYLLVPGTNEIIPKKLILLLRN